MTKARDLANGATALNAVSATELSYIDGVTSAVQTQIDAKLASSTAATTYQPINSNVSTTELGYLDGVTSSVQTQINSKIDVVPFVSGYYYKPTGLVPGTFAPTNQVTYYTPIIIPTTTTFNRIATYCSGITGTSVVRMGLYNSTAGKPSTVAFDAGTVTCTTSNTLYEITINQTVSPGLYWLAHCQQTAPTAGNYVGATVTQATGSPMLFVPTPQVSVGNQVIGWSETGISGAFATAGTLGTATSVPYPYLKVA